MKPTTTPYPATLTSSARRLRGVFKDSSTLDEIVRKELVTKLSLELTTGQRDTHELAKWRHAEATFDMLQFGLRLGERPRQVVTTTPRPIALLKRLIADPSTAVARPAATSPQAGDAQQMAACGAGGHRRK